MLIGLIEDDIKSYLQSYDKFMKMVNEAENLIKQNNLLPSSEIQAQRIPIPQAPPMQPPMP
jgi:rhamnose utilization protein RhaD (predicted bifunctional aldolase and dehydrogenase)